MLIFNILTIQSLSKKNLFKKKYYNAQFLVGEWVCTIKISL